MIPILGMHRSGTSALAGALHRLGADLGDEASWIPAASDNPAGFFEFEPIVAANRAILRAMGGTWSSPPHLPSRWQTTDEVTDERDKAADIAEQLSPDFVIKDPRMTLTWPLWAEVTELKRPVFCIRHPRAVAASLERRNGLSLEQGLFLWFRYNAAPVGELGDVLIIEYENLVRSPDIELDRIASHVGLEPSPEVLRRAADSVRQDNMHHSAAPLPDSPIADAVSRLYDQLRGAVETDHELNRWKTLLCELPWAGPSDREISIARRDAARLEREASALRTERDSLLERNRRLTTELRRSMRTADKNAVAASVELLAELRKRP